MCGISGVYRFDSQAVDPQMLQRMLRATVHRGPDDEGTLLDSGVGLAHNRLSILDLSPAGHQPMRDVATGNWIVYNGEIYNFQEIRRELISRGHVFRSTSDTEVLLYAYRQWGESCLDRINGMFAFAIYVPKRRELFLARDRIGIKPLYYYSDEHQFVFASETKALIQADGVPRRIRRDALPELLAFRYLAGGRTLLEGIEQVPPGHSLRVTRDGVRLARFWDIPAATPEADDEAGWIDRFHEALKQSVRYQLIADVPVGCALSGGIDSTAVTAVAQHEATSVMKTFTIGFDAEGFDERPLARRVDDVLGVENYSEVLSAEQFYSAVPKLVWHLDEPMNHPNSIGIWLLAKLARDKVTVLLSGEGGDELLAGYTRFRNVAKLRPFRRTPGVSAAARLLSSSFRGRAGTAVRLLANDEDGMMIWSSAYLPRQYLRGLVGPSGVADAESHRRALLETAPRGDWLNRHTYYELKTYLVSLLIRIDKMCMANSLENRVPLLDHTLVELAARMPSGLKSNRREGKIVLRRLLKRWFTPDEYRTLFDRRKVGFNVPAPYFRDAGFNWLKDIVTSQSFRQREWIDPRGVERILTDHASGKADLAGAIWLLATLEIWARTFIDRPGVIAS